MGRNILFITTDQQRFDSLGCNGGLIARTPVADNLAKTGVNFTRANCNNPVCMPARTTMFNGQHPLTHGVTCNGINYSSGDKGIARWLKKQAGYKTALIGKSHFEPMYDMFLKYKQNRMAAINSTGPWLGFDHAELALHGLYTGTHYAKWLLTKHPEFAKGFALAIGGKGGGDTGAPEVAHNPIPRELYHTDWVADRTIDYLDTMNPDDNWFVWMSFPDPHHPFDPPAAEQKRINWRDLDLPPGHPGSHEAIEDLLSRRPQHWLDYFHGRFGNPEGAPGTFVPSKLSADQIREINAVIHVENELIDEACGRVIDHLDRLGMTENTDIFFTSDHGDMQGDMNMVFKGPFHVDSLMHLPLIYKPAASAGVKPAVITDPVSQVDFVPTFCEIAGVPVPPWAQGQALPVTPKDRRERTITSWDSQYAKIGMHLRTIHRDGYTLTAYLPSTRDQGGRFPLIEAVWGDMGVMPNYTGSEGELYDHKNDPHQFENRWDDAKFKEIKSDLISDLFDNMPPSRKPPRKVVTPV